MLPTPTSSVVGGFVRHAALWLLASGVILRVLRLFLYSEELSIRVTILFLPGSVPVSASAPAPETLPWEAIGALVYMGLGITFLVYFVINYALTRIKVAHGILFSNLIPVSTLLPAYLVLGETLNAFQYGGAAMVLCGVLLAGAPEEAGAGK